MGYYMKNWRYIATVQGTSQGNTDISMVEKSFSQYDGTQSQEEAMAKGRAWASEGGWQQILADKIIESQTLEH